MKWISVKEELPKEEGEYLVYGVNVTTFDFVEGRWWSDVYKTFIDENKVTHWMPLPKPPK